MRAIAHNDLPYFREKLRTRMGVLRAEIRAVLLRSDSESYAQIAGHVHDAGDEALADVLVDVNIAEISRDVAEVRDIDAALRRLVGGTYGICIRCGESIDWDRLNAHPTAKRCLPCQKTHDRSRAAAPPASL